MRKRTLFVSVCAYLLFSSQPAVASSWALAAQASSGSKIYVDLDTIVRSGSLVTVWEKWDNSGAKPARKEWVEKNRKSFDCQNRRVRLVSFVDYDRNGGVINSASYDLGENQFRDVTPDSVADGVMTFVCSGNAVTPPLG